MRDPETDRAALLAIGKCLGAKVLSCMEVSCLHFEVPPRAISAFSAAILVLGGVSLSTISTLRGHKLGQWTVYLTKKMRGRVHLAMIAGEVDNRY